MGPPVARGPPEWESNLVDWEQAYGCHQRKTCRAKTLFCGPRSRVGLEEAKLPLRVFVPDLFQAEEVEGGRRRGTSPVGSSAGVRPREASGGGS